MAHSSHSLALDNRLLTLEELFRQRRYAEAQKELGSLSEKDFQDSKPELGVFYSLSADGNLLTGEYRRALELSLKAVNLLAGFTLNRRYARALLVTSKAYYALGDLRNAEIRARDSLAAYRRAASRQGQIDALNLIARVAYTRADYKTAASLVEDALDLAEDNPRQLARLKGNAGAIRVFTGDWAKAETLLTDSIKYHRENGEEMSLAINLLSLGSLYTRQRKVTEAGRLLTEARQIIERLDLKRESIIYLELAGELAFVKGDTTRAKYILSDAYQQGRLLAPESALVSQSARLLAEVEYALENDDEAMKYAQKSLELAMQLGEKSEVGMAMRLIAELFARRRDVDDALEYSAKAVEQLREVGDPLLLGRALLSRAGILITLAETETGAIQLAFDEARSMFAKLRVPYWRGEVEFQSGVFACRQGDLAGGFRSLSQADRFYAQAGEKGCVRNVRAFLTSIADQAVARSLSGDNEYKVLSSLLSRSEWRDVKHGRMEEVLEILCRRTDADRAIIIDRDHEARPVVAVPALEKKDEQHFLEMFARLIGEEVAEDKPTLLLDCRRDPFIRDLARPENDPITSVIVVPFAPAGQGVKFLYLERVSPDNSLRPFDQQALNFAVGFSELIAFKAIELQQQQLLEDNRRLKTQLQQEAAFPNIITRNSRMIELLGQLRQVVDSDISIAIEGETGSGKDLLARAIHYNSNRRDKRFISVNCAALPETLLESELFGYKRGAFTGADRDKPGLFEEADGGTFFLDEIADMPLSIQAKILRVLEAREIVRLGDSVPRKVNVRIVSATNKVLVDEMAAGRFRQDLYYRLTALTFTLLPLRERKEDIPLLIDHFLEGTGKTVTAEAMKQLVAYDWPGNIRELENEIKKMVLLAGDSAEIGVNVLSSKIHQAAESHQPANGNGIDLDSVEFNESYSLYDYLAGFEKQFIIKALREHRGVKKHAAASLNIPESTLRLKV
ncbi:MAG: hypothetical protein D6800_02890, partial [Candidatus Zixiibacteriota bacterium]